MIKVAILIDGGYFLKRLRTVRPDIDVSDAGPVASAIDQLVRSHLRQLNETHHAPDMFQLLYRSFYYDAKPYTGREHFPVSKTAKDYAKSEQALFRKNLFKKLHGRPNFAVRLGDVRRDKYSFWVLKPETQKCLLAGKRKANSLTDEDFVPALRQKGVDMRIGLDIASIALKRQASTIVLVSGDADFVPAAKLARREGVQFILDPLWRKIDSELYEHIDLLRSGFSRPAKDVRSGA
ncbi:MAG: NYN domain-containing protein [Gammaproteobacteria bacterium]|nr:NYN domain-containing protein [Gammaproteobacteria bacterium]